MKAGSHPELVFRESVFGEFALAWSEYRGRPAILRIVLPRPGRPAAPEARRLFPGSPARSCPEVEVLARDIEAFLSGDDIRFGLGAVRMDMCPRFQQQVLRAEHAIPRGSVASYGGIAGRIGRPGAARAVGGALARNLFPIVIPCHRAVRSDRSLGGYQGGPAMKRALLEMEGLVFAASGRLAPVDFYY
jgi:methylated-DNA-[protein]-cysteine S-methyltransferase